jgi:hypothetical protein
MADFHRKAHIEPSSDIIKFSDHNSADFFGKGRIGLLKFKVDATWTSDGTAIPELFVVDQLPCNYN